MQIDLQNAGQEQGQERAERGPFRVRVPFLPDNVGLGDVVASLTKAAGVKPCGGCQKRRAALNNVQLSPWET